MLELVFMNNLKQKTSWSDLAKIYIYKNTKIGFFLGMQVWHYQSGSNQENDLFASNIRVVSNTTDFYTDNGRLEKLNGESEATLRLTTKIHIL